MALEIERKFLIKQALWHNLSKPEGEYYKQGYILADPSKTIRVRITPTSGFLTIKGKNMGAVRSEFEYPIPVSEAKELLGLFAENCIEKIRYKIPVENHIWEVDVFLGANEGLIVAEIELQAEDEIFSKPEWIDEEVTTEAKYYNSNLSVHPFSKWQK